MRDPLTWSLPLGNAFGISIRVHILMPLVALGLIMRAAFGDPPPPDLWQAVGIASGLMGILFVSVLLHEFGHCFGARLVDGDASEILLWPLGGLASIDVPRTPRANFIAVAAGPAVNALLCLLAGGLLAYYQLKPPLDPWWYPYDAVLYQWDGQLPHTVAAGAPWIARFFYINWILFLFNVLLIGFPMDGGRLFQCLLWPRLGYAGSMRAAIFAGFLTALIVGIYAVARDNILALCLCGFIYITCRQQWLILEHGGEESMFGYDFSQGYTSLEREAPPRRRRPNFIQRWLQKRAARKVQRELEAREEEERRMDELLEKVQREGLQALSDEERRFLTRVSAKYRNRQ